MWKIRQEVESENVGAGGIGGFWRLQVHVQDTAGGGGEGYWWR